MNDLFAVHSYFVLTTVPSRFDSHEPINHSRSRSDRPSPGHSRAIAISHLPSSRAYRKLHRLTTNSPFAFLSLKFPSTTAVSLDGNRIESTSTSSELPGFFLKNSAYPFSRSGRPRKVAPSSLMYSPSVVQCSATTLPSPLRNAATKLSSAF